MSDATRWGATKFRAATDTAKPDPGLCVLANHDPALWLAWQFDVPEKGEGMVQAFRRDKSAFESARFPLAGLDAEARYVVTNLDSG